MSDLSYLLPHVTCLSHAVHYPWPCHPAAEAPPTPSLATWKRHQGACAAALSTMPGDAMFDPSFLGQVRNALGMLAGRNVALLYVIAHHQPHYRSPILPHLLGALPRFSSVYSLRDSSGQISSSAQKLLNTVLQSGEACLLVHDLSRRLIPAKAPEISPGAVHYTLFTLDSAKGSNE